MKKSMSSIAAVLSAATAFAFDNAKRLSLTGKLTLQKSLLFVVLAVLGGSPCFARTDCTVPAGTGSDVITFSPSFGGCSGTNAFDNGSTTDGTSRWLGAFSGNANVAWVCYQFATAKIIDTYRIQATSAYSFDGRAPNTFKFQGSNDGSTWTDLDSRSGVTGWTAALWREYSFANTTAYTYYRLYVTALNGSTDYCAVQELEFYEAEAAIDSGSVTNCTVNSAMLQSVVTKVIVPATYAGVCYGPTDGGLEVAAWTNSYQFSDAQTLSNTVSYSLAGLTANSQYYFRFWITDGNATNWADASGTFLTASPTLAKVSDGDMTSLAPCMFTISRPSGLTSGALTVNYAITGGTAIAGTDYTAPSGSVIIPDGAASTNFEVAVIRNIARTEALTLALTLTEGPYALAESGIAVEASIANSTYPAAPTNTWIGSGNASDAANWSLGHVPATDEDILLSYFSTNNMTWDAPSNGLSSIVASWTQAADYIGTVTFRTTYASYDTAFTNFTVTGDCALLKGSWTHLANYNSSGFAYSQSRYRLAATIGGNLDLGPSASFTAYGRGFAITNYTKASGNSVSPHGGWTNGKLDTIGDFRRPESMPYGRYDESGTWNAGGGCIRLSVGGAAVVDGTISADGNNGGSRSGGSGGSIWIDAASLSGSGVIKANGHRGNAGTDWHYGAGSGGRIAIYTTADLAFPVTNIWAYGSAVPGLGICSACGTIYLKNTAQANGTLVVNEPSSYANSDYSGYRLVQYNMTPVTPGETWTLDKVIVGGYGRLCVPTNATLVLPNGLASIEPFSSSSTGCGLTVLPGGTLSVTGDQSLKSGVCFQPAGSVSLPAGLTISSGARVGTFPYVYQTESNGFWSADLAVAGDLTVEAGGKLSVEEALSGAGDTIGLRPYANHGGWGYNKGTTNLTYDSVLRPALPGSANASTSGYYAGGLLRLTVGGTLTVNGTVSADGKPANGGTDSRLSASAGSLDISVGSLAGTGTVTAVGGQANYYYSGSSGGGRVAIRLMNSGATFSDYWITNIVANGHTGYLQEGSPKTNNYSRSGSAGTVYLQTVDQGEAVGVIRIANDDGTNNPYATPFPGLGEDCDSPSVFATATLDISRCATVLLTHDVKLVSVAVATNACLDLAGRTLTVSTLTLANQGVATGTYAADAAAVSGYVMDSVGGGSIIVKGDKGGFVIRICESDVAVPYLWITNNLAAADRASDAAISNALVTAGANGLSRWESYALGLDPNKADSVVLCDAKQDASAASATLFARNVVAATNDAFTVSYVLEGSNDGASWTDNVLVSPTNAFVLALSNSYLFYRIRTDIVLE